MRSVSGPLTRQLTPSSPSTLSSCPSATPSRQVVHEVLQAVTAKQLLAALAAAAADGRPPAAADAEIERAFFWKGGWVGGRVGWRCWVGQRRITGMAW